MPVAELISIITPAFQAEAFLPRAVHSVLAQTWHDWEMLIVADDHFDYAALLAEHGIHDERIRLLRTGAAESGAGLARNLALEHARGRWIAPLDADDAFMPERLQRLWPAAQKSGLSLDNFEIVVDRADGKRRPGLELEPTARFGFPQFFRAHAPLLFLADRTLARGGWDIDLVRGQDTIFNLRLLERAGFAEFVDLPLHEYRIRAGSACHSPDSAIRFRQAYRHALQRLEQDGLGLHDAALRERVRAFLLDRSRLNDAYAAATAAGFSGDYQQFVQRRETPSGSGASRAKALST